jgi:branched-chain amino acid transport system ATP-binding protein
MSENNMLEVQQIDAYYGSLRVLMDISIEIKPGETVAIIGANGSGKSTLLKTITGMIHPKGGKILFDGQDITNMNPYQIVAKGISMVPEGRRIFPDMTVYENLRLGSYLPKARPRREENLKRFMNIFRFLKKEKNNWPKH